MRTHGVRLSGTQGEHTVRVEALHLSDVQRFGREPVDIAIICTKSYDTEWAAALIVQYLATQGYVVSMQNGINEERLANVVAWDRAVGCIVRASASTWPRLVILCARSSPAAMGTACFAWAKYTAASRRARRHWRRC